MLVCSYREKRKMQVFCLNKSKIVSQTRFQFTFHRICLPSLIEFIWIPFEIDGVKAVLSLLSIVPPNHLQPFSLCSSNRRLFPRTFLSCLVFRLSSKEEEIRRCSDRPDFSISTIEKGKVVDGRVERYAFNFYPSFFEQGKKISTGGGAFYDEEKRRRAKRYAITREGGPSRWRWEKRAHTFAAKKWVVNSRRWSHVASSSLPTTLSLARHREESRPFFPPVSFSPFVLFSTKSRTASDTYLDCSRPPRIMMTHLLPRSARSVSIYG